MIFEQTTDGAVDVMTHYTVYYYCLKLKMRVRVDQIYEVEIANLQGHLQEILSREFLHTIRWYMTSFMTSYYPTCQQNLVNA